MKALSTLILLLLYWLVLQPVHSEQFPFNFVAAYKTAMERRLEADNKLRGNMQIVADFLFQFRKANGHLPEAGTEEEFCIARIQKLIKANPYSATGIQSISDLKPSNIKIVHNCALNDSYRRQWEAQPPADWKAEPGSITAIVSEDNYVLVWGAGADHSPIRDDKGRARFCLHDCSAELQN